MVALKADLKASNEVPPNESKGTTGSVTATFDTDSNKLSWKGTVSGLSVR
ncbi:MAG: CHRD domain-containing protein [Pseudolabrys sp.]